MVLQRKKRSESNRENTHLCVCYKNYPGPGGRSDYRLLTPLFCRRLARRHYEGAGRPVFLHLDDAACISKIDELFEQSLNNSKTVMYDRFQKLTKGIS